MRRRTQGVCRDGGAAHQLGREGQFQSAELLSVLVRVPPLHVGTFAVLMYLHVHDSNLFSRTALYRTGDLISQHLMPTKVGAPPQPKRG